jgi:acetylornithine deacetylase/succinyl-diaminopimelate desuccinylase-like protein
MLRVRFRTLPSMPFFLRALAIRIIASAGVALTCTAFAQSDTAHARLRALHKELVEIDTTDSTGSCTVAAEAMRKRLVEGGIPAADAMVLVPTGAPKKGNLIARLKGDGSKKPILLLGHLDVVEAKREDWARDPFRLIEEDGYLYARGAFDDKAMAAIFLDNLLRYRAEGFRPARDIVVALTCDEEIIPSKWNGVEYLLKNHRALIDAEFALNEGASGLLDNAGKHQRMAIQAGEKTFQTFQLEVIHRGGHSSVPVKDNAITHLAEGLARLGAFDFPVRLLPVTRAYFERMAAIEAPSVAADMRAILKEPPDPEAVRRLSQNPAHNATLRTTCVATMLEGGHATNALPQRARATVNCRILPGEGVEEVTRTLVRVLANDKIRLTPVGEATLAPAPPLSRAILDPVEAVSAQLWPGVPVIPTLLVATTDSRFLNHAGIPAYGLSGLFRDPDGNGVHGLNERIRIRSLYDGHEFLYRVVKAYAGR